MDDPLLLDFCTPLLSTLLHQDMLIFKTLHAKDNVSFSYLHKNVAMHYTDPRSSIGAGQNTEEAQSVFDMVALLPILGRSSVSLRTQPDRRQSCTEFLILRFVISFIDHQVCVGETCVDNA